ncbi:hypothetical protein [Flexithrix dorotheae]|uniref:hypothetical protein n=1 Tax=Flexithrix dorotheae TaxID=70993 RepID=UPI00146DE70B|nr:hypothetical protein [Flexithrix dorotheae]
MIIGLLSCEQNEVNPIDEPKDDPVNNQLSISNEHLSLDGSTLYLFAKDFSGEPNCEGECAEKWPPVFADQVSEFNFPEDLDAANFGIATRPDGSKQLTYYDFPLYKFANDFQGNDSKPGTELGEGLGGVWFVAKPYTVFLAFGEFEGEFDRKFLIDFKSGKTLYYFNVDNPLNSNCENGGCFAAWPPYYKENITAPSILKTSDFESFKRDGDDKLLQSALQQHPLYYFAQDGKRGDTKGHNFNGGTWIVADVENIPPFQ